MLILDTRTNDLERTRFPQDPISHIFKLIIEASTKLLQVKYSTRSGLDTESLDNDKIRRYTTEMREKYLSFWWHSLEGEKDSLKYFKRVLKAWIHECWLFSCILSQAQTWRGKLLSPILRETSLPCIEIRQRVFKKEGEKGKESGGIEAMSKKKTILKVISCQFNEIANSYSIIKRCFYCDKT